MRRLVIAAVLLATLGLTIWAFLPRPVAVEVAQIGPQAIEVTVMDEGEARIREVFTMSATLGGKLQRTSLHAGDAVVGGQTVVALIGPAAPALLDARARAVAEATMAAAQAAVDLARAQVTQAEAALEFALAEAGRAQALFDHSTVSRRMLDTAILNQRTAEATLASAKANLAVRERERDSASAVLGSAEANGGDSCCIKLIAPVSGRVLRVLTEDEQVVQPGTPILEIGDPGDLEIVVELLSRDAVRVQKGAMARITGWGGAEISATVDRIEPSAVTRVSALGIDEQRVEVILRLQGDPAQWQALGHGFRVLAEITLWRGDGVLAIPVGALFRDRSDWATFVLRDGRARLQVITLGERDTEHAEVLGGLSPGDQVILYPNDQITDGRAVRVSASAPPSAP